jgi:uncharacterized protein (DUF433 family)
VKLPDFLREVDYGEILLVGSRISLYHIVSRHEEGMSAEANLEEYPTLSIQLIEKVLDFYRNNRADVDAYVRQYRADLERQEAETPRRIDWEELRRKFEAMQQAKAKTGQ